MDKILELGNARKLSYLISKADSSCTLIFEAGLGDGYESWIDFLKLIDGKYSYLAYSRPGLGKSDNNDEAQSLDNTFIDLESILDHENLEPPFVFIGHSFGGAFIKHHAMQFSKSLTGLVFVDASDSGFVETALSYRSDMQKEFWNGIILESPPPTDLGLNREFRTRHEVLVASELYKDAVESPTAILVCGNLMNLNFEARTSSFPEEDAPFSVLERDNKEWVSIHESWKKQFINSTFRVVSDCSHYIHHENPLVVLSSIEHIVGQITNNRTV